MIRIFKKKSPFDKLNIVQLDIWPLKTGIPELDALFLEYANKEGDLSINWRSTEDDIHTFLQANPTFNKIFQSKDRNLTGRIIWAAKILQLRKKKNNILNQGFISRLSDCLHICNRFYQNETLTYLDLNSLVK